MTTMPKFLRRREHEDADPATGLQAVAEPDSSSARTVEPEHGACPEPEHDQGGVYDQDVDEASVPVSRGGTPPDRDEADNGHTGINHNDQYTPADQGVPYRRSEVRYDASAVQHEDPLVQPEPHPAREEANAPDGQQLGSALMFPEPVVIGASPSFPVTLGTLPTTPGNMSGSAVPDTALDGADLPGLVVRGASLRGEDHRNTGIVRQDSMGMWRVNDDKMAAVLVCATDGVSSQPNSHRGAVAICQLLRDLAQEHLSHFFKAQPGTDAKFVWGFVATQLAKQLSELAVRQNMEPVTVSTTLAAALIEENPEHPAERRYVILNVGDATAYLLRGGEFTECLTDPHEGEITESRTWTLPTSAGEVGTAAGILGPGDMLMVCSDGMSNPMRNGDVRDQLARWWSDDRVPGLLEFGWQAGYRAKTYGDDRTAVCVWNR
jgi:serine/threonine protein phosphatase PrpC